MTATPHETTKASRTAGIPFLLKTAFINALIALVLFSLMIGIRTEAGSDGQLTYWTRFGDLASIVAAVFGGSIVIELLRQWIGPTGEPRSWCRRPCRAGCRSSAATSRRRS